MANSFDLLDNILFTKIHDLGDDIESNMVGDFVFSQWVTGYSPEISEIVNETINRYSSLFVRDKKKLYDFYFNIIPKLKRKKIRYFKREREKKEIISENVKKIEFLAENMEMSVRELEYLIKNEYIDIKNLKIE